MPKLLLIDDDPDEFFFIKIATRNIPGLECLYADGAAAGLQILTDLKGFLPDIIFLDINMPAECGRECLKKLKESKIFKDIPVVMYTTADIEDQKEEWDELGADFFLRKLLPPDLIPVLKFLLAIQISPEEEKIVKRKLKTFKS